MMALISVIIPCYNVEKYIEKCLNTLLAQTFQDFEIIVVDDGSTDRTADICDQYAEKDSRIMVTHISNRGQGAARNIAIKHASAEYITFVDSDDYVDEYYLEYMWKLKEQYNSDFVNVGIQKFYKNNIPIPDSNEQKCVFSSYQAFSSLCYQREINNGPVAKLLKKDILDKYPFPEGIGYEDFAVIYKWILGSDNIVYSSKIMYYYRQLADSTMNKAFNSKKIDRMYIAEEMRTYIQSKYPQLAVPCEARFFVSNLQTLMWLPMKSEYKDIYSRISKNIKSCRKSIVRNKDVKISTRVMALASYLGIYPLRFLGGIYRLNSQIKIGR